MENTQQDSYKRAKKRVCHLKAFYNSLVAYCIVIPVLVYINYHTTSFPWAIFPTVGWGMGLVSLWMTANGRNPIFGKGWEERKIREFMNKEEF